MRVIGAN
jgi:hypothetical protein